MNDIEKLLRKVAPHDRDSLLETLRLLREGNISGFRIERLSGSDFYKTRKGNFRFIFHCENAAIVVDTVKLRNEKTYRGL
jgi:mRNA-degrading endonuclease RelE of RelBE toxin-antitoxin system